MNEFDKFRFGVFEEDLFSNLWLAFAKGNDFYLGVRSLMPRVKVSFHESCICHLKIGSSQTSETPLRWYRSPTPDQGTIHVATVRFPGRYNKKFKRTTGTPKKKLFGAKAAPEGKAIEFGFFYSREPMDVIERVLAQFSLPMVRVGMPNGDTVSVAVRMIDVDEKCCTRIHDLRIPSTAVPQLEPGGRMDNASAIFINDPSPTTPLILTSIQGFDLTRR